MSTLNDVFIVSYARTPIGSFQGLLSTLTAPQLGSLAIKGALERAGITGTDVDEVYFGNALQAGLGQAPARQSALGAGISNTTPCTTVNKMCSSSTKAIIIAAQTIQCGANDVVVAGGTESMSRAPYYLDRGQTPYGGVTLNDSIATDGLLDVYTQLSMGLCAESLAKKFHISREDSDQHAIDSYQRSISSSESGLYAKELVPVTVPGVKGRPDTIVQSDEELTRVIFDKIPTLKPAFSDNGVITAATTGAFSDAGAALVLMSAKAVEKFGVQPLAKIVATSDAGVDPIDFGLAPTYAVQKLLKSAGISREQVAHYELNEPFACVGLSNIRALGLANDIHKINPNGGSVALGHPLGFSGARIVGHLAMNLGDHEYGVASTCNGGGGASALLLQKV
ncbi:acetyl-CoA acetyltransferase A, mitochondrial-like [Oppia nitens]|uniref:acetyl-CoA acetyltransferase A, mitochondrial-like n=1 Tax=Oppia nitens TaxID=1686743 RepID=UPI0023DAD5C5|nr:acetyl-CoA acetyltransferase A, mitochondrial-like [Oppia nitens]